MPSRQRTHAHRHTHTHTRITHTERATRIHTHSHQFLRIHNGSYIHTCIRRYIHMHTHTHIPAFEDTHAHARGGARQRRECNTPRRHYAVPKVMPAELKPLSPPRILAGRLDLQAAPPPLRPAPFRINSVNLKRGVGEITCVFIGELRMRHAANLSRAASWSGPCCIPT